MEKALAFYYGPLHLTLFIESVLQGEATNRALSLPAEAKTRSVIVQGDHEYGKIALASAMNYEIPAIAPDAVPPNIGYLAQSFQVADLRETAQACAAVGAETFSGPMDIDLPGRGKCAVHALLVELETLPLEPLQDGTMIERGTAVTFNYRCWAVERATAAAWAQTLTERFQALWPGAWVVVDQ